MLVIDQEKTYNHWSTHFALPHVRWRSAVRCTPRVRTKPRGWYKTKPFAASEPLTICSRLGPRPFFYCQCDGWCLSPAISLAPASPPVLSTRSVAMSQAWSWLRRCKTGTATLWFTWAPLRKALSHHRGCAETLWKADKYYLPTQKKTGHLWNCKEHKYYEAKLLPFCDPPVRVAFLKVCAGGPSIACLAWFWHEGGWEELFSVSQRSLFFFFLLIYFMLPHSMVVSL